MCATNWLFEESKDITWSHLENKCFENALALYDKDTHDRWLKVAAMVPGKTVRDVIKQYKELAEDVRDIDAGLIPIPAYSTSSFRLDWFNHSQGFDGFGNCYTPRPRPCDRERKKGAPWTEEEHRQFLMGLKRYGKGDWRSISRNFATTRTPTQVASHAQKYFMRQLTGGKDKRRSSIHDITTINVPDTPSSSSDHGKPLSPNKSFAVAGVAANRHNEGPASVFDQMSSDDSLLFRFCGVPSYGPQMEEQNLLCEALIGSRFGSYDTLSQMQSM